MPRREVMKERRLDHGHERQAYLSVLSKRRHLDFVSLQDEQGTCWIGTVTTFLGSVCLERSTFNIP